MLRVTNFLSKNKLTLVVSSVLSLLLLLQARRFLLASCALSLAKRFWHF